MYAPMFLQTSLDTINVCVNSITSVPVYTMFVHVHKQRSIYRYVCANLYSNVPYYIQTCAIS